MALSHLLADASLGPITGVGKFQPTGDFSDAPTQIESMFTMVFGFLTIVAGLTFLIYFLIGALNWVTGGGDEKKVDTAKSYMTNGAIGLIIVIAAYSIVFIVGKVLGLNILDVAGSLNKITGAK